MAEIKQADVEQEEPAAEFPVMGHKWIRISLFNLLLVALVGCLMRYKIAYSLPWLPQKSALNAHSKFALAGWLSMILMTLMVQYLSREQKNPAVWKKYNWLLWGNLLTAYALIGSLIWEGYGFVTIVVSTLSVLISYVFAVVYWLDLNRRPARLITHLWFKAALIWNVLSSLGPFMLAYMLAARITHENWYLATIYFFLHFQYNGWFFFVCGGLLYSANTGDTKGARNTFYALAISCAPAYFLSILWAQVPFGTYLIAIVTTIVQLVGWCMLLLQVRRGGIVLLNQMRPTVQMLFVLAALAGSIKFLLQFGSVHPELAKLTLGFRPIVIGYLHLVLLGFITIFIIAFLKHTGSIASGSWRKSGIVIFVAGIIIQELLLFAQGTASISYTVLPFIKEALLAAALVMLVGIALLNAGMFSAGKRELQ